MVKKAILTTGVLTLVTLFFVGRDALSYLGTTYGWFKTSVKSSIPIDFEIERARQMVKKLVPDIRRNMHVIAQEEVEVERLQKQIDEATANLDRDRADLLRLKSDVQSGSSEFKYSGRTYTIQQVKVDLAHRFDRFKTHDATLASLRDILAARQRSLDAARQKLEGMLAAKRQLEVDVENLDARLKMVEVAQTTSDCQFDDSQLGHVRELVGELRTRLKVSERLVNVEDEFQTEIPLNNPAAENVVDQITEYFGGGEAEIDEAKIADAGTVSAAN